MAGPAMPIAVLACVSCVLWLTAGIRLLMQAARTDARPDYFAGLGLLLGGLATGVSTVATAAEGAWPVGAVVLAAALLWSFGAGQGDEATALQRGDRWLPLIVLGGLAVVVQGLPDVLGPAPVVHVAVPLRPLQIPVAVLLLYLWRAAATRPPGFFQHLGASRTRELTFATACGCIATAVPSETGDAWGHLLSAVGPACYLTVEAVRSPLLLARIAAVAIACSMGFQGMAQSRELTVQHHVLQGLLGDVHALALDHAWLQAPVETSVIEWVHEEPEMLYERMACDLRKRLQRLRAIAASEDRPELGRACQNLVAAMASHARWSRDTFQSVAVRRAAWSDDAAVARAEARAVEARRESARAHQRGRLALQGVLQAVGADVETLGQRLADVRSTALAMLVLIGVLGAGLLRPGALPRAVWTAPQLPVRDASLPMLMQPFAAEGASEPIAGAAMVLEEPEPASLPAVVPADDAAPAAAPSVTPQGSVVAVLDPFDLPSERAL